MIGHFAPPPLGMGSCFFYVLGWVTRRGYSPVLKYDIMSDMTLLQSAWVTYSVWSEVSVVRRVVWKGRRERRPRVRNSAEPRLKADKMDTADLTIALVSTAKIELESTASGFGQTFHYSR
jgi:hypothetical protein